MQAESPKLLIKIPTRSRPAKFFDTLDKHYKFLSRKVPYHFLISCDSDDPTMNNPQIIKQLKSYPNLSFSFEKGSCKVAAYNRDIHSGLPFDILLLSSDDMIPACVGYDKIIVDAMLENFPDFDGVLNFHDGNVGGQLNTLPVIGKKFFDRFGFAYNPAYLSLFCDEELTVISRMLGKEKVIDTIILKHMHPSYKHASWDDLYKRNQALFNRDKQVFIKRQQKNFDFDRDAIDNAMPMMWSILICTLDERADQFNELYTKLMDQIKQAGLEDKVEVLFYCDNREATVGYKRNQLLLASKGKYVCFIDDDDDVHDRYIEMIYERLLRNPDCINLIGVMTRNGNDPRRFIHSIEYDHYFESKKVYYRPPNHLNPMRRSIAIQYLFPEKNVGEDTDWAMKIAKAKLLKTEERIAEPYYYYQWVTKSKK